MERQKDRGAEDLRGLQAEEARERRRRSKKGLSDNDVVGIAIALSIVSLILSILNLLPLLL